MKAGAFQETIWKYYNFNVGVEVIEDLRIKANCQVPIKGTFSKLNYPYILHPNWLQAIRLKEKCKRPSWWLAKRA